ncbi:MAG: dNTP triphosphohydrolase, partial [Rikenellaceae bacterium]|nr:dNTP triphosphohydrolase [Rikenellaceae bacterium]
EIDAGKIKRMYLNPMKDEAMEMHFHDEETRHRPDGPYQRDYARIMYSSSFRRLQGKMQLLGIKNDQFFRNRLTHSLEVTQIARSIAAAIQYDATESYVVEAGALAHDLGNPPFGHAGERFLNDIFINIGGFEGNAQTLRILTNVEKKRPNFRGLNLTYRTLLSVVKYFKKFDKQKFNADKINQKFIYDDDYEKLKSVIDQYSIKIRTIDVQIVDIADEIAYAAHDLEDGLRVKAYTIDEILHDYQAQFGNKECYEIFNKTVAEAREKAGYGKNKIDSTQYSKLFRQELSSRLINLALNDIDLVPVTDKMKDTTGTQCTEELGFLHYNELIHGLKTIVFRCINHNDEVYHYEEEGEKVIRYLADLYRNNEMYLPPEYRADELMKQYDDLKDADKDVLKERLICDYISGMMDSYAISTYEKYSGRKIMG